MKDLMENFLKDVDEHETTKIKKRKRTEIQQIVTSSLSTDSNTTSKHSDSTTSTVQNQTAATPSNTISSMQLEDEEEPQKPEIQASSSSQQPKSHLQQKIDQQTPQKAPAESIQIDPSLPISVISQSGQWRNENKSVDAVENETNAVIDTSSLMSKSEIFNFYWIDATEVRQQKPSTIYLFGKVIFSRYFQITDSVLLGCC